MALPGVLTVISHLPSIGEGGIATATGRISVAADIVNTAKDNNRKVRGKNLFNDFTDFFLDTQFTYKIFIIYNYMPEDAVKKKLREIRFFCICLRLVRQRRT
jgi:hypothetical protein